MPFQFGANWSRFADATANVLSPLFAYEDLTAFFLESAFLPAALQAFLTHKNNQELTGNVRHAASLDP